MNDIVVGLIAILTGAVFCFRGYLAMRIIIPPLTSQYLNLTKNSSLGIAIAYPDLVGVFAGTVLNQTGQAVEVILLTMLVYLTLSLLTSAFMNWFNSRMKLVER